HDGHQQRARRPSALDEDLALQKSVVLTIALVGGDDPTLGDAEQLLVRSRTDSAVHVAVDLVQLAQPFRRGLEAPVAPVTRFALVGPSLAELDESERRNRLSEDAHVER